MTSQQSNVFPNLGSKEAFLSMCSIDGIGSFNPGTSSRQLPAITSFQSTNPPVNSQLNNLIGIGLQGISSSGMIQLGHGNSVHDLGIHHGAPLNQIPITTGNQLLSGFADSNTFLGSSLGVFLNDIQPSLPVNHFPTAATYSSLPPSRSLTSGRSIKNETSPIPLPANIPRLDASSLLGNDPYAINISGQEGGKSLTFSHEASRFGYAEGPQKKCSEVRGQGPRETLPSFSLVNRGGQSEFDFGMFDQQHHSLPFLASSSSVEEVVAQSSLKVKNNYPVGPSLFQLPAVANSNPGSYVDPVSALIKMVITSSLF